MIIVWISSVVAVVCHDQVVKSFKVPVVKVSELTNRFHWICHRSSGVKSVGRALKVNRCLTSCGEVQQSV